MGKFGFWVGYLLSAAVIFVVSVAYDFMIVVHGGYGFPGSIYIAGALMVFLSSVGAAIWWAIRRFRYAKGVEVLLVLWLAFIGLLLLDIVTSP